MAEVIRPRTIGEILEQTFSVLFRKLPKLLTIYALFWIPAIAISGLLVILVAQTADPALAAIVLLAAYLLAMVLQNVPNAAAILAVAEDFTGKPMSVGRCFSVAWRKLFTLLGIGIAVMFLTCLASLALIIPGIIVFCMFWISAQTAVIEDLSMAQAMGRSRFLTRGNRWRAFCLLVLIGVINAVISQVLGLLQPSPDSGPDLLFLVGLFLVSIASFAITSLLTGVAQVVFYFELRARKEAFDVAKLADMVDQIGQGAADS